MTAIKTKITNFDISFEGLRAPTIDFDIWLIEIVSVGDLFFLVDWVFRVYFTIRLCFKYWDVSSVKIPQVDIRTEKEVFNPFKLNHGRLFFLVVSNPLVGALLASTIVIWILAFSTSVYIPIFEEYRSGCIPQDANGTFVAENIYSSAYNFAYRDGSSSLVKGADTFETTKSNTCASMFTSSATKQNDNAGNYGAFSRSIQTVGYQMSLFEKCIDKELADAQFSLACCSQAGYARCDDGRDASPLTCPMDNQLIPSIPYSPPGKDLTC